MLCFIDIDAHQFVWQIHLSNISERNHWMFLRVIHAGTHCVRNHVTKMYLYLRKLQLNRRPSQYHTIRNTCNRVTRCSSRNGPSVVSRVYVYAWFAWLVRVLVCIDLNPRPSFVQACLQFPAMSKEGDKLYQCRITSTLRPPAAIHCKKKLTETSDEVSAVLLQTLSEFSENAVWICRQTFLNF